MVFNILHFISEGAEEKYSYGSAAAHKNWETLMMITHDSMSEHTVADGAWFK